ncbi:MAG TPA: hypothetical protein VKC63_04980 [Solirubrobacterales bacterium]|nr:hypothetical protein [Solirubrobacterales bacterium]
MRARRLLGIAGLATLAAALWWRKNPSACPYGQRFWVEAPHRSSPAIACETC